MKLCIGESGKPDAVNFSTGTHGKQPRGHPPGLFLVPPSGPKDHQDRIYIPTFSLYQAVVWDFGRVMGSHQARLMMSWERRPMARETLKKTV